MVCCEGYKASKVEREQEGSSIDEIFPVVCSSFHCSIWAIYPNPVRHFSRPLGKQNAVPDPIAPSPMANIQKCSQ